MRRYQEVTRALMNSVQQHIAPAQRKIVEEKILTWFADNFQVYGINKQFSEYVQECVGFSLEERLKRDAAKELAIEIFKECAIDVTRNSVDDLPIPTWDPKVEPRFHTKDYRRQDRTMYVEVIAMRRTPRKT